MKNALLVFSAFLLSTCFFSCEKSDISANNSVEMDIESAKANKKNLAIGMEYQGGIIFYLDETGKHGLITAKTDLGPAPWGCLGTSIPGAQGISIGEGEDNSKAILKSCKTEGIAARLCSNYVVWDNGKKYADWFLPSYLEFSMIGLNLRDASTLTCNKTYLTSSEGVGVFKMISLDPAKNIWTSVYLCGGSGQGYVGQMVSPLFTKSAELMVRPIRSF